MSVGPTHLVVARVEGMERNLWSQEEQEWLVRAAQAGDLQAFDTLVRHYRPGALAIAAGHGHMQTTEDAVQDAFLAAYTALPKLEDPARFAGWLGAIVRNRAKKLSLGQHRAPLPLDEMLLHYVPALVEDVTRRDSAAEVQLALSELPADLRDVMRLYYLEEWPVREISEFLQLPVTTVKWRLHTGRSALRHRLACLEES